MIMKDSEDCTFKIVPTVLRRIIRDYKYKLVRGLSFFSKMSHLKWRLSVSLMCPSLA